MRAYKIESTPYNTYKIYELWKILWLFPIWVEFESAAVLGGWESLEDAEDFVRFLYKKDKDDKIENERVSIFKPQTYYYY